MRRSLLGDAGYFFYRGCALADLWSQIVGHAHYCGQFGYVGSAGNDHRIENPLRGALIASLGILIYAQS